MEEIILGNTGTHGKFCWEQGTPLPREALTSETKLSNDIKEELNEYYILYTENRSWTLLWTLENECIENGRI